MLSTLVSRIVDIRPGESRRVGGMFALLGLIIATGYILKPVRSALFLSQFGAERLPYVYLLVALVLGVVAAMFARWVPRINLPRLFVSTSYVFSASLLVFWLATVRDWPWTGFAFYVLVSIFTALMPSLFWLLANYVFYSNEGRRLFPVVMAGGLLGSILGGAVTSVLVLYIGTSGLLLAAASLLIGVAALIRWNTSRERERMSERRADLTRRERQRAPSREDRPWAILLRSRYLSMLAVLLVLTSMTSTLVDYQFNTVVEDAYETRDALTGFFGTFFALLNVLAFALQILLAGRLLSRLGVAAGLLILPVALLASSAAFFALPVLATAVLIKTADDGFSNSVNKASVEVLYLPISLEVKNQLKTWLDIFVERVSRGLGGLAILLGASLLTLSTRGFSLVVIALLVPWILLALALQREYVKTFRDSFARRDITDFNSQLRDQASLSVFHQVLSGGDERELLYALELLQGTDNPELLQKAAELTSHASPLVRRAAIRLLRTAAEPAALRDFERRVHDEDARAGAEALALWMRVEPEEGVAAFEALVKHREVTRIQSVFDCMEGMEELVPEALIADIVERHCEAGDAASRGLAARAIGFLPPGSDLTGRLRGLLEDPDVEVARAAARSAGKLRHQEVFSLLTAQLRRPPLRLTARKAIARFGPERIEDLAEMLRDGSGDFDIRLAIPRTLAELDDQRSVDALLSFLPAEDRRLHYQGVKSLGKLRSHSSSLHFSRSEIDRLLGHECQRLVELSSLLTAILSSRARGEAHALVVRVLEERLEFTRERTFRLLGLEYPQDEIYRAWDRIVNGRPSVRAAALEYLANVFSSKQRASLLPLLEAESWESVHQVGLELGVGGQVSFEEALRRLIRSKDDWLAACAVTMAGPLGLVSLRPEIEAMLGHPSPIVREAASQVLGPVRSGSSVTGNG